MPAAMPVLVIAGERDPVGSFGRGPRRLVERFRRAGMQDVQSTLYPDARHELFNESNREVVQRDVIAWLDGVLARRA
jgi:alpha-beta hydrolase superfamily lysophospholipase